MKHIKQHENKKRRPHKQPPVTPEDRKLFWEMISRKGGIHIRF